MTTTTRTTRTRGLYRRRGSERAIRRLFLVHRPAPSFEKKTHTPLAPSYRTSVRSRADDSYSFVSEKFIFLRVLLIDAPLCHANVRNVVRRLRARTFFTRNAYGARAIISITSRRSLSRASVCLYVTRVSTRTLGF